MKRSTLAVLGGLAVGAAVSLQLRTALAQGAAVTLVTTFTNPTPVAYDNFGYAVASVGTGRVLIGTPYNNTGAYAAGAAFLFSTQGTLLTTFTNPVPTVGANFGYAVATVGADRVLVGAPYENAGGVTAAGRAYLLSTNGALLTTFTNPTPATYDDFGIAVAALGADRVLIGAYGADTGATDAGVAYLFSTNGALLTTFTNPTPAYGDLFGNAVAAVGTDRVLIGAFDDSTGATDAGAAYLFNTNGTLLTTFTNPTPEAYDNFGNSLAAVGSDRVLIGAYKDNTGAGGAGQVYLFSTNGTLLTTFTNPAPSVGDNFGNSVAAVGSDRVLIGAFGAKTGASYTGAAYLFSINGALLATFTNPAPASFDVFGCSVAAVGNDRVLIGAYGDDTGATDAGSAYLFSLETAPVLSIRLDAPFSTVTVSWPGPAEGWVLESTNALPSVAAAWPPVPPPYQTNAGTISVVITNLPAPGYKFFRLHKQ